MKQPASQELRVCPNCHATAPDHMFSRKLSDPDGAPLRDRPEDFD